MHNILLVGPKGLRKEMSSKQDNRRTCYILLSIDCSVQLVFYLQSALTRTFFHILNPHWPFGSFSVAPWISLLLFHRFWWYVTSKVLHIGFCLLATKNIGICRCTCPYHERDVNSVVPSRLPQNDDVYYSLRLNATEEGLLKLKYIMLHSFS